MPPGLGRDFVLPLDVRFIRSNPRRKIIFRNYCGFNALNATK
jgi:hypothetical protein